MGQRLNNPFPQFWSSSAAYSGGTLTFFASGGSTPLAVYSDKALSSSIGTSVTLNSAGRYIASDIFLSNVDYKVVLKDSDGVTIWTADPVRGSDFTSVPLWSVGSGSPSGVVAGTAASSGVMPSMYWDYTNSILYVCTTTGIAAAAVWTAINASASTPAVPPPQGRLTPTTAVPVITVGVTSGTALYYTPYVGNLVPIYNGATMVPTEFSELTLTLASQHAISSYYDVFAFSNSGVVTLATGPAWSTLTAGSSARGTGAGTTQLTLVKGLYTNAVSMTGRNGATTYTIAANKGTYLGTIFIDGTAGQITCHIAYGQTRKCSVWNAYNRKPIILQIGDATASWSYGTATIRQSRATAGNTGALFCGLADETAFVQFAQLTLIDAALAADTMQIGIGVNSTTTYSGRNGVNGTSVAIRTTSAINITASHIVAPSLGLNNINCLEKGHTGNVSDFYGGSDDMLMTILWNG